MPPKLTSTNIVNSRRVLFCFLSRNVHSLFPIHAKTMETVTEMVLAAMDWSKGRAIGQWYAKRLNRPISTM